MKAPFRFVGLADNHDTVMAFEELGRLATNNLVLGSIIVPIMRGRTYSLFITGEAARSKTFAAGAVSVVSSVLVDYAKKEGFRT